MSVKFGKLRSFRSSTIGVCFAVSDPAPHYYSSVLTISPSPACPTPVSSINPKQASAGLGFKERGSRLP